MKHEILMLCKEDETEILYKDVVGYMGLYGCLTCLEFEDGTTATFDNEKWLMFDLTPTRGWNCNAAQVTRG